EVCDDEQLQGDLNAAATAVTKALNDLLQHVKRSSQPPKASQHDDAGTEADALLALAKAVANATAQLVLNAKNVAGGCDDSSDQNRVIGSATQCALATSELVACAKVVAPTINSPACQEQLVESAKHVARSVEGIVTTSKVSERC
ncbi:PREDICTED: talin-2-like, partial [Priapulus caudatus]|uniref:Talin-2-like n=1 Tax=Priapulus caudatus TaxID=37621 RepID=A0ABM1F7A8_PRICU